MVYVRIMSKSLVPQEDNWRKAKAAECCDSERKQNKQTRVKHNIIDGLKMKNYWESLFLVV